MRRYDVRFFGRGRRLKDAGLGGEGGKNEERA